MNKLTTIGRILFALPFGIIGINHFVMTDVFTGMLTSFIPGGGYTVLMTGVALISASISIMIKKFIPLSCYLLAGLLFIFILTIHIPSVIKGDTSHLAMINLLKDTGLMGGALVIAGLYQNN